MQCKVSSKECPWTVEAGALCAKMKILLCSETFIFIPFGKCLLSGGGGAVPEEAQVLVVVGCGCC